MRGKEPEYRIIYTDTGWCTQLYHEAAMPARSTIDHELQICDHC